MVVQNEHPDVAIFRSGDQKAASRVDRSPILWKARGLRGPVARRSSLSTSVRMTGDVASESASIRAVNVLEQIDQRPDPLPSGRWRMAQRWNNLLFAHWPITPEAMAGRLPAGLDVDLFDGQAWLGVVPFSMDRVRVRTFGERSISIPGTRSFAELNLRTYVRSRRTGQRGVYFFSLDAASLLAVLGARVLFHLPYFPAAMVQEALPEGGFEYRSRRWLPWGRPAEVRVRYRPTGPVTLSRTGDLASFLTERYCLFTRSPLGHLLVGEIHHQRWPLQPAEAEFLRNDLPADFEFALPTRAPVLYFARALEVYIWGLRREP